MYRRKKKAIPTGVLVAIIAVCVIVAVFAIVKLAKNGTETPETDTHTKQVATNKNNTVTPSNTNPDITEEPTGAEPTSVPDAGYDFRVCFCGDINFDETYYPMQKLNSVGGDLTKCISPELLEIMNNADVMVANNEFTYTNRGTPLAGKAWTFRADPKRVFLLKEMGVDVALLANNHAYDYGEESLIDTMQTLKDAGIQYFGAGYNLDEAKAPLYLTVDGKTIALVAASRAEKNFKTPQATDEKPGILLCYDTELFVASIKEARQHADFVIAVVHWGTEYSNELEPVQEETAKLYIDAGADAIIGAHSHCPQPIDFYNGKPIVYSLSNFWFNDTPLDSMLIELHFYGDDSKNEHHMDLIYTAATQHDVHTEYCYGADREKVVAFMEKISGNKIKIDNDGLVTPVR